jgi:WD40 repeat protein
MVKVWDWQTEEEISIGSHKNLVVSASFSPDEKKIATTSHDKTVKIWNAKNDRMGKVIQGHPLKLTGTDFHPDGKRILTSSNDGKVKIWHLEAEDKTIVLCRQKFVSSIDISPDGRRAITVSGREAKFWDIKSRKELSNRVVHSGTIKTASFSPEDGSMVITANDDNTSIIWDARNGTKIRTLSGHRDSVNFAAFSPDESVAVTASNDQTAKIWDVKTGKEIRTLEQKDTVLSASFDPESKRLVACVKGQPALVWDWEKGKVIFEVISGAQDATFSPIEKDLISINAYNKNANVWDTKTGEIKFKLVGHLELIRSAYYSPDGKRIVTTSNDDTMKIWDAKTGKELLTMTQDYGRIKFAKFFPSGRSIVFHRLRGSKKDSEICIWEAYKWENSPNINVYKQQNYADWLKANDSEVKKN